MKLGIMQPYFLPHLGYFDLIYNSDKWIVFDSVQYIRKGWMNRNRILHPGKKWQYISVPIQKAHRETAIYNIKIKTDAKWQDKIFAQLTHYKKKAPFYSEVTALLEECFSYEGDSLSGLNKHSLQVVCDYLGISFSPKVFSEMGLEFGKVSGPGDWALRISEALGADVYVNPPGGVDIFDPVAFERRGIEFVFRDITPLEYDCSPYTFVSRLSIVDVLMWNKKEAVLAYVEASKM